MIVMYRYNSFGCFAFKIFALHSVSSPLVFKKIYGYKIEGVEELLSTILHGVQNFLNWPKCSSCRHIISLALHS